MSRRLDSKSTAMAAGAGLILAALVHSGAAKTAAATPAGPAATTATSYARAQLGSPYVYGGTGPYGAGFDCSGLVMMAWRSAGVSLPRTSQEMWAQGQQVSTPQPGDLVYFAGADGTMTSPGHVGIVVDPATDTMIDAYATGYSVEYDTYGPDESKPGLSPVVGFTDPAGG